MGPIFPNFRKIFPKANIPISHTTENTKSTSPRYAFSMGTFACKVFQILSQHILGIGALASITLSVDWAFKVMYHGKHIVAAQQQCQMSEQKKPSPKSLMRVTTLPTTVFSFCL